ncbi:hypothetical protein [Chitinophaga sp. Cy-1792]|uniref:hypothetical protein n=1 Tax=Chitinophaga sp. Cy-1792 TaxID=2608339 RepID=UPI00142048EF|nr:hypothetical protein [Chitinophaga sp. Cy-1792]NIG57704.1 hypothetical protein [Chitinophaga sp. Cy-1792]
MVKFFRGAWLFIKNIYLNAERATIGPALSKTGDLYEQAKIKLLFDYIFFYCCALMPVALLAMITMNDVNLILIPFIAVMLLICLFLLRKSVSAKFVGGLTSYTTLLMPILSSFFNNQDITAKYACIWFMSILLCYITVNLAAALSATAFLVAYLSLVAWLKLEGITLYVSPGFSRSFQYLSNPFLVGVYMLFLLRSLGSYYKSIIAIEKKKTLQQQQQQLSIINQQLTKQFLLVKGFSRSGQSAFVNGELELLEACFSEIEKQCGIAINYLNESTDQ